MVSKCVENQKRMQRSKRVIKVNKSNTTNRNRIERVDAANQELKSVLFISPCENSELVKKIMSLEEQNKLRSTNQMKVVDFLVKV